MGLLACPGCAGVLSLKTFQPDSAGACLDGVLRCTGCPHWYPIVNRIPRLLLPGPLRPDDGAFRDRWDRRIVEMGLASPAYDPGLARDTAQVQATFGYKWKRLKWWGLEGESAKLMEEWLPPRYGWRDQASCQAFMCARRRLLDAGSGLGREALRMARANPAGLVLGLELSGCVDDAMTHASKA